MADHRSKIQEMFEERNRFACFGDVIARLHARGFRCHVDTEVEINSPITAFCGLNGTGKSTLLQLASVAYESTDPTVPSFYIKDFLVVGTLDPRPFTDDASVEYRFYQGIRQTRPLTLSRNSSTKRWQGYARRPSRTVLFAGIGLYLPKIEQKDFIIRNANRLTVSSTHQVAASVRDWTCRILGHDYDQVFSNLVAHSNKIGKVVSVQRQGAAYSEAHMGYGEGRSQYLVTTLEALPDRSLVLIEEPETSLHPSAQRELGLYLIDVVYRKRHQVLLTTHSEFMLEALPSASRVFLYRDAGLVRHLTGLTVLQAKSMMSSGRVKSINVFVEDGVGEAILREILMRVDPQFAKTVGIYIGGDANFLAEMVKAVSKSGLAVAAVRDGDQHSTPKADIYKLPGILPPEKEIFQAGAFHQLIQTKYGLNLSDFMAEIRGVNHHDWFELLSERVTQTKERLVGEAAATYAMSLSIQDATSLTDQLREAARK